MYECNAPDALVPCRCSLGLARHVEDKGLPKTRLSAPCSASCATRSLRLTRSCNFVHGRRTSSLSLPPFPITGRRPLFQPSLRQFVARPLRRRRMHMPRWSSQCSRCIGQCMSERAWKSQSSSSRLILLWSRLLLPYNGRLCRRLVSVSVCCGRAGQYRSALDARLVPFAFLLDLCASDHPVGCL